MEKISPENHEKIYEHFANIEINKKLQSIGFFAMHLLYKSDVYYENNSDEKIHSHLSNGGSVILAPNHQSLADTPTIAGLVYEDAFKPLKGTTIIPAKAEMFIWPLVGRFIPHMLAHPAFRSKSFDDIPEGKTMRDAATNNLINFNIDHLNNGGHCAIFSESTRNRNNPKEVRDLKTGIARIAMGVKNRDSLAIIPMGFAYRIKSLHLRPLVVAGEPIITTGMNQEEILDSAKDSIQEVTTKAFELVKI